MASRDTVSAVMGGNPVVLLTKSRIRTKTIQISVLHPHRFTFTYSDYHYGRENAHTPNSKIFTVNRIQVAKKKKIKKQIKHNKADTHRYKQVWTQSTQKLAYQDTESCSKWHKVSVWQGQSPQFNCKIKKSFHFALILGILSIIHLFAPLIRLMLLYLLTHK